MFKMYLKHTNKFTKLLFFNTKRNYGSVNQLIDIKVNEKSKIATIFMQRKPVNAMNYQFSAEFVNCLRSLDENIRGVIITSNLSNVFCAGFDLKEFINPEREKFMKWWDMTVQVFYELYNLKYPTVAAINGHAPAGGCVLSLCTDYRIMLPNFKIGLNETNVGLFVPKFVQELAKQALGFRKTEILLTTGSMLSSTVALQSGYIDKIVNDENDLRIEAENFINQFHTASVQTKLLYRSNFSKEWNDYRPTERDAFYSYVIQPDFQKICKSYIDSLKK